jgi:hypothetical protein
MGISSAPSGIKNASTGVPKFDFPEAILRREFLKDCYS